MIQRIQSLYLLLTSLLSILFLKGAFLTFFDNTGSSIEISLSGIMKYTGNADPVKVGEVWTILILSVIIPVLSIIIISLYKKRDYQLILTKILIIMISAFIGTSLVYSYIIISKYEADFTSWYKLIVPVLQLIVSVLAYYGIKKDDELVKSYDRLR